MSEILSAIYEKFGNSEPIFKLEINDTKQHINFDLINKYVLSKDEVTDPVERIMIDNYEEYYQSSESRYVKYENIESTYRQIADTILRLYVAYSPLKNPKQSKMYKWIYEMRNRNSNICNDGFIMLYRYIENYRSPDGGFVGGVNNPHIQNVLAILEKMKEKYERKTSNN